MWYIQNLITSTKVRIILLVVQCLDRCITRLRCLGLIIKCFVGVISNI